MKYPSLRQEGGLFGATLLETLDREETRGQRAADFGLAGKLRDEIAQCWAEARAYWQVFRTRAERVDAKDPYGTSRTRQFWIMPLFALLGYELEAGQAETFAGKSFAISHRARGRALPVHVLGFADGLDRRRETARQSPHGLVQEYLNLSEENLYALLTNGLALRLLRDSSRLVKLSYLEFDLEKIFEEELYADFALLYRLLHASRMPRRAEEPADCLLESYHQVSLEDGSRLRERLSDAVREAMLAFGNGLLTHPANGALVARCRSGETGPGEFHHLLLMLIYRCLFLLVIEERGLVHPPGTAPRLVAIYHDWYSLGSLRRRLAKAGPDEARHHDLFEQLQDCFRLHGGDGAPLSLASLGGTLFAPAALAPLAGCRLSNAAFRAAFGRLDSFHDEKGGRPVRVNYASLNVEEFGSVYEGLLEYEGRIRDEGGRLAYDFGAGAERGQTGSHYTPDDLIQPLLRHGLEPVIEKYLAAAEPAAALLSIRLLDPACGSGHILLAGARRIALELARVREDSDQPSPSGYRAALREVVRTCVYGVDANPLAVELCKVALWLEAHVPGEPLGFLDHHIKCGDSVVGLARREELEAGIPDAAWKTLPGDDKETAAALRRRNASERTAYEKEKQAAAAHGNPFSDYSSGFFSAHDVTDSFARWAALPETSPAEVETKKAAYAKLVSGPNWCILRELADLAVAPFFLAKTPGHQAALATDAAYRVFLRSERATAGDPAVQAARAVAAERRFFHWFLEFPEVFAGGGFDCVLGNPPFLGGQHLSGTFGPAILEWLKHAFAPAGSMDLVGYFFRRAFTLLAPERQMVLISTNTIAQGGTREGGLAVIEGQGGTIHFAVRSMPWPGAAAVSVSLVGVRKGPFAGKRKLDNREVARISSHLDDAETLGEPFPLAANAGKSFQGSIVLGSGFILEPEAAAALIRKDPRNREVLFPYLNGEDLNSDPEQRPSRWVINFHDWPLEKAREYPDCFRIVEELVKPERMKVNREVRKQLWWQFAERASKLYRTIASLERVLAAAKTTKYVCFSFYRCENVFDQSITVIAINSLLIYSVLQSTINDEWSRKFGTTHESRIRYNPSDCFDPYPFPGFSSEKSFQSLSFLGESYHEFRRHLMQALQLGLTKLYNQFHNQALAELPPDADEQAAATQGKDSVFLWKHLASHPGASTGSATGGGSATGAGSANRAAASPLPELVLRAASQSEGRGQKSRLSHPGASTGSATGGGSAIGADSIPSRFNAAVRAVHRLRELHVAMDLAVRDAYGWNDLALEHGFHEVDYLPENDRTRYTISPAARREVLSRLLALNHQRHAEEVAAGLVDEAGKPLSAKSAGAGKAGRKARVPGGGKGQGELW